MMDNYDRVMELVDAAYNSAGSSQTQFEKTLDSLQSKLNRLANAWTEFTTGITNSELIKVGVDVLTGILEFVNNLTDNFGSLGNSISKVVIAFGGLMGGSKILQFLGKHFLEPSILAKVFEKKGQEAGKTFLQKFQDTIESGKNGIQKIFSGDFWTNLFSFNDVRNTASSHTFGLDGIQKAVDDVIASFNNLKNAGANAGAEQIASLQKTVAVLQQYGYSSLDAAAAQNLLNAASQAGLSIDNTRNLLLDKSAVMRAQEVLNTVENIDALSDEAKAKIANIGLTAQENNLVNLGTAARLKNTAALLFGNKTARAAALQNLGLASSAQIATGSMKGLSAAMYALPTGYIIAGLAAVAAAIYGIYIAVEHSSVEYKLERSNQALEFATEKVEELRAEYDELNNSIDELNDLNDTFDGLIQGTDAWKQAIVDTNQAVIELLNQYKELAPYISTDKNGRLVISQEGFDTITESQQNLVNDAQGRQLVESINNAQLEQEKASKDLINEARKLISSFTSRELQITGADFQQNYVNELTPDRLQQLINNWDSIVEPSAVYSQDELDNIRNELFSSLTEYNNSVISSGTELSSYFSALTTSLGIAVEGVDNFSNSLQNSLPDAKHYRDQFVDINTFTEWGIVGAYNEDRLEEAAEKLGMDLTGQVGFTSTNKDYAEVIYGNLMGLSEQEVENRIKKDELGYNEILDTIAQELYRIDAEGLATSVADYLNNAIALSTDKQSARAAVQFITDVNDENAVQELVNDDNLQAWAQILDENGEVNREAVEKYLEKNNLGSIAELEDKYGLDENSFIRVLKDQKDAIISMYQSDIRSLADFVSFESLVPEGQNASDYLSSLVEKISPFDLNELNGLLTQVQTAFGEGSDQLRVAAQGFIQIYASGVEEDIDALRDLTSGITDWSSAIDVASNLRMATQGANAEVSKLAQSLLDAGGDAYEVGGQFREFYLSSDFTELTEQVQEFVEENGEITAENVEELAESSSKLDKILSQDIISTNGLAKALTGLQTGEMTLAGLTTRTLEFLDSLVSVDTMLNQVHKDIEGFDAGLDTGEGIEFLAERAEAVKELMSSMEYGNEQLYNNIEYIYGPDALKGLSGQELIDRLTELSNELQVVTSGDGYGFWHQAAEGLFDLGDLQVSLDESGNVLLDTMGHTTEEVVKILSEGTGYTEAASRMYLAALVNHSADVRQILEEADLNASLDDLFSIENSFLGQGERFIFSQEEIENMAAGAGMAYNEFLATAQSYNNSIRVADWLTDDGLEKTGEELLKELNKVFDWTKGTSSIDIFNDLGASLFDVKRSEVFLANYDELYNIFLEITNSATQANAAIDALIQEKDFKIEGEVVIGYDENGVAQTKRIVAESTEDFQNQWNAAIEAFDTNKFVSKFMEAFEHIRLIVENDIIRFEFDEEGMKEDAAKAGEAAAEEMQDALNENPSTAIVGTEVDPDSLKQTQREIAEGASTTATVTVKEIRRIQDKHAALAAQQYGKKLAYASGTEGAPRTETSLVGEEGPELIQRDNSAFLVGTHGPEITTVEKGDRIYNADDTKKIVSGRKIGGISSYASGTTGTGHWNQDDKDALKDVLDEINSGSSSSSSSSSSLSSSSDEPYQSALDVYYNFISRLDYLNNELDDLINERDKILEREATAIEAGDLSAVAEAQNELERINDKILEQQKDIVQENSDYISGLKYGLDILENKIAEYGNVIDTSNGYMLIHWDAYNNLNDEAMETVDDLISEWEDYYDRIEESKDAIQEVIDYYDDLAQEYRDSHNDARDEFLDLISSLTDVLINIDEEALQRQQEYYDQLIEQDQDYLDALRKNVEERRRIRDQENDYEDLAEKQRRLSLLQRDSSGVYANEIASLQEEIASMQQDLADQEIDNILDKMDEDLALKEERFNRHIELMEDQIEQAKKNGEYAQRAEDILRNNPEEAVRLLTTANPDYLSISEAQREDYLRQINSQMVEMDRYLDGYYLQLANEMETIANLIRVDLINAINQAGANSNNFNGSNIGSGAGPSGGGSSSSSGGSSSSGSGGGSSGGSSSSSGSSSTKATIKAVQQAINRLISLYNEEAGVNYEKLSVDGITGPKTRTAAIQMYNWGNSSSGVNAGASPRDLKTIINNRDLIGFRQGGLVDFTGPTMVHGSKNKPEAFLNAEDTKNIAEFKDILKDIMSSNKITSPNYAATNFKSGDCTIYITVDQISNDYDIDRAIEQVQRKILASSSYRNVNLINRTR